MLDPYNQASTLTWHCVRCWDNYGGVPGKAVAYPWPLGAFVNDSPTRKLANVFVTDYGFPKQHMIPAHTVYLRRTQALIHHGATVLDHVDATNGTDTMSKIGGRPWLVVWGSPHPNTFNDLFPLFNPDGLTNKEYKASVVAALKEQYPGANIVMPHPSYYDIDGAVVLSLPPSDGVTYTPMASGTDTLQRLCAPENVRATYYGSEVEGAITESGLNLRALCQHGIATGKCIIFMGEYVCDLSYVCLL
jgi:hypothetical protein